MNKARNVAARITPNSTPLMGKAVEHFDRQLKHHNQSPRAAHYLKQRGLNTETCKAFGIGFAPPGWDNLQKELATSLEKEKQLISTGMLVHNEDSDGFTTASVTGSCFRFGIAAVAILLLVDEYWVMKNPNT